MNPSDYPDFQKWIAMTNARNNGLLLVVVIAVSVVVWLANARFIWPKLLPAFRLITVAAFYVSLALIVIAQIR